MMMNGYDGYHSGYGMMYGGWHFIIPIIIISLIVFAIYKLATSDQNHTSSNSALEELNKKFVNGDISEDEYLQKKQIIKRK